MPTIDTTPELVRSAYEKVQQNLTSCANVWDGP